LLANRITNLAEQYRTRTELESRARRLEEVARLGRDAMAGASTTELFDRAVRMVSARLGTEYGTVLRYRPEEEDFLLENGVGWDHDTDAGEPVTVGAGSNSQAGYTLGTEAPVVVEEFGAETQFRRPPLLADHGVVSGISVVIGYHEEPWGVFGAHSTEPRVFTDDDISYVQNVASVLGCAIQRGETEHRLRETTDWYERIFSHLSDYVAILDDQGRLTYVSPSVTRVLGGEPGDYEGTDVFEHIHPDDHEAVADAFSRTLASPDAEISVEVRLRDVDGNYRWTEARGGSCLDDPLIEGVVVSVRRIEERKRHEQALTMLNERSQRMTGTDDPEEIRSIAARTGVDLLEADGAVVLGFDGRGSLTPATWTGLSAATPEEWPPVTRASGPLWEAFVEGTERTVGPEGFPDDWPAELPFATAVAQPVGNHGLLVIGTTTARTPSAAELEAAKLLGDTLEVALARTDREATLDHRERTLARQNEQLARLDQLNTLIRRTTQAVIRATAPGEVLTRVCEQFADAAGYAFAWVGSHDGATGTLGVDHSAAIDTEYAAYLGTADVETPLHGLVAAAMADGTVRVAGDVLSGPDWTAHRRDPLNHGFRSIAVVPILERRDTERVLTIHGTDPDGFDDRERAVLAELGRTIGYALANLDPARAASENIRPPARTELEIACWDRRLFSNQLAAALGDGFELVGLIPADGDRLRLFVRFEQPATGPVEGLFESLAFVVGSQPLSTDHDTWLYQVVIETPRLVRLLRDRGVGIRSLTVSSGETSLVLKAPGDTDVRGLLEAMQESYPESELEAKRETVDPVSTRETFRDRIVDALTEKQLDALQTAVYGGYYEWPRTSTSEELAATRDIAGSTFQYHLRAAERKLVTAVLDDRQGTTLDS
jgi:PAS domain S-box-containing protein